MPAYEYQLIDARNDIGIKNVAGVCSGTVEFADLINRVTRRLMKRGGWFDTEQLVRLCLYGCDIVMPRYVGTLLGVRSCGSPVDMHNNWYSILGPARGCANFCGNVAVSENGTVPCHNEITGNTGKYIRYHVVKAQDVGKTITLYGKKYGAQPLQHVVSGNWEMGEVMTATSPDAQTTTLVTKIDSIVREATQGMAYLYEVDPATGDLHDLAVFDQNETNPRRRRYTINNIQGLPCFTDSYGRKVRQVEAMVKLQYIPVKNDNDFLFLSDFDALAMGIQAIKNQEAGNLQESEICFAQAIKEMNFTDRDKQPSNQLTVRVRTMGSNRVICNPI